MIDFNQFPMHKKPYADNTLRCMPRKDLIAYIRDIEHNYETLYWFYQNAVNANLEKFKDFERVVRCRDCKHQRKENHPRAKVDHWTYWCDMDAEGLGKDSDFCSMAERREE